MPPDSAAIGKQIVQVRLPKGILIVLVGREGSFIVPSGGTTLRAGDRLLVLAEKAALDAARAAIEQKRSAVEEEAEPQAPADADGGGPEPT